MITSISLAVAPRRLRLVAWLMVAVWTLALAASVVWNVRLLRQTMLQVATQEARTSCNKDMHYLLNPAYMTRQVHAMKAQENDVIGHITSLKPLRPENAPDAWEAAALRAIQPGETEVISRELLHGRQFLRYLKPLVTTAACLECHTDQGYKAGEHNGGISVAVPLDPYLALAQAELWPIAGVHVGLWALGVLGIGWGARQMRQRLDQQLQATAALRASEDRFRTVADFTADMEYWRLPDGSLAYMSPSCERLTGYSAAEFLQAPELLARIVHPEDRPRIEGHFHDASETTAGPGQCDLEFRIYTRSGEARWIGHVCQPVVDREGKFQGRRASNRDITARQQAEETLRVHQVELEMQAEELRQSQAALDAARTRYFDLYDLAPVGYLTVTESGLILEANQAVATLLDVARSELVKQPLFARFILKEDQATYYQHCQQLLATGEPQACDLRMGRRGGALLWVHLAATTVPNPAGVPNLRIVLSDITERRQAEETLRTSEAKHRLLFESAGDAIFIHDEAGRMLAVNPAACERLGYTHAELMAMMVSQVDSPAEAPYAPERITRLMEQGQLTFETAHQRKDGSSVFTEVSARRITWDGQPAMMSIGRDITERKRAAEVLRQSEERYRSILNATPDAIAIIDATGRIVLISPGTVTMFGYKRAEEVLGKWATDFVVPEDRERMGFNVGLLFQGQSPGLMEYRCLRADGSLFDVEANGEVIRDAAGQPVQMVAIVRDITERKAAEAALKEQGEQLQNLFDNAPVGIFHSTPKGRFLAVNPALVALLGHASPEELLATTADMTTQIYADPTARPKVMVALMETDGWVHYDEVTWRRKDGSLITVDMTGRKVLNATGGVAYLEGFVQDITERKQAEEELHIHQVELEMQAEELRRSQAALAAARARYFDLYDLAPVGYVTVTESGVILESNLAAATLLGVVRRELVKQPLFRFILPEDQDTFHRHRLQLLETEAPQACDLRMVRRDGTPFWAHLAATVGPENEGAATLRIVLTDITARQRAEAALRLTRFSVESASDALFWMTADARIVDVNTAACRSLGYTREELLQLRVPDVDAHYSAERWPQHFAELRQRSSMTFESEHRTKDGRLIPVEIAANYGAQGNEEYNCAFVRDITARRQAEAALRESELKFRSLFETTEGAILLFADDRWVDCNAKALSIFGGTREQIIGAHPSRFSPPLQPDGRSSKEEAIKKINLAFTVGPQVFEWEHCRADGTPFAAEVSLNRLDLEGKPQIQAIVRDITERQRAEAALRESELKFRSLFETAEGAILLLADARFVDCNAKALSIFGGTREQLIGALPSRFSPPMQPDGRSSEEKAIEKINLALTVGPQVFEWEHCRADGTPFAAVVSLNRLDLEGKPQLQAIVYDITERKLAEAALRESETNLNRAQAIAHLGSWSLDMARDTLDWSAETRRIFGVAPETPLTYRSFLTYLHPDDQARVDGAWQAALQGAPYDIEHRIIVENQVKWVRERAELETGADGNIRRGLGTVQDITERKLAEAALRESEERFRNLLRDVPGVAVQGYRMDGTTTYWNQASEALYGYTEQEALGRNLMDLVVPPEMREDVRQAMRQMAETGQPIPASELSLMRKDGSRVAVFSSHVVVRIPGRAAEMFCLDIDLTKRKLAEAALRESETKFKSMVETLPLAIYLSSGVDQISEYVSPTMVQLFGYTQADIPSAAQWWPLAYPDATYRQQVSAEWTRKVKRALETQLPIEPMEVIVTCKDGSQKDISWGFITLGAKNYAFGLDLTSRKQAEAALRESEDRFRGVVEGAAMPIFVTVGMKFSYLNPAALRLLGAATPEQVLGQPVLSRIHPDYHESIQKRAVKVFQGQRGMAPPQAEVYLKLDGTPVPVEATASPITYQGQPAAVVFVQDITERQRLEAANTLLEAQFRQAQKLEAIGQLSGGIAHDFNNILAAILGNADLAVMDTDPSHPARASLEEIMKAGLRAKGLVQQILTYSRQQPQDRHVIPLEPIIAEAAKFLHATIPAGVEIVLALAASAPSVLADATQIHQVILNLGTNAWHALEDQPGRITIQLRAVTLDAAAAERLAGLRPGSFACLTISDTGKGMDAATLEHIFNPFFTTKAPGQGTGLGLSVVQGIVAAHDGAITVVSQPGQGTTFQVYFPAVFTGTADSEIAPGGLAPQGQGQHVLLLDDGGALVNLVTRMLERLGYRVTGFTQAAAAMQAFRTNPGQFDVVITDLNMPGISGLDVARELLIVRPDVPVLLCSGHVTEQMQAQAHSAGIRHVLYKPNTLEEVSATLHHLFTQPGQPGPNL